MWVLNTATRKLHYFNSEAQVPGGYAILSHTWGEEEATFDELQSRRPIRNEGHKKVENACRQAREEGFMYIWIDTCCIDKRSSAELSEAINSMYRWYGEAKICYVLLSNVECDPIFQPNTVRQTSSMEAIFRRSRWFTRGWTLQELIAPEQVCFYDRIWRFIGDKATLVDKLHDITGVDMDILIERRYLPFASVAKRMSWAAERETSRVEDRAYSLLGIFDVNLPMLYGEGSKAFLRLQEEIIRTSTTADHSILAWKPWNTAPDVGIVYDDYFSLLSPSPHGFRHSNEIISWALPQSETFELSQRGLKMTLCVIVLPSEELIAETDDIRTLALNCRYADQPRTQLYFRVSKRHPVVEIVGQGHQSDDGSDVLYDRDFTRRSSRFHSVDVETPVRFTRISVTLARKPYLFPWHGRQIRILLDRLTCAVGQGPTLSNGTMLTLRKAEGIENVRYGYLVLKTFGHLEAPGAKGSEIILVVRIVQPTPSDSPWILVDTIPRRQVPDDQLEIIGLQKAMSANTSIRSGQQQFLEGDNGQVLSVTRKYVSIAGEMLWSLEINARSEVQPSPLVVRPK